jgi:hypothetical protein
MKVIRISSGCIIRLVNWGFLFYEQQAVGLGDYFSASLRSDIEELKNYGGSHRVVHREFHRSLSRIFPYGIYYTFSEGEIHVYAEIVLRRDPEFIRRHLDKSQILKPNKSVRGNELTLTALTRTSPFRCNDVRLFDDFQLANLIRAGYDPLRGGLG